MYDATLTSWMENELCRAHSVPSGPVLAYRANAMVDAIDDGRVGAERDVFLRVAAADHCDMVTMQFLDRLGRGQTGG